MTKLIKSGAYAQDVFAPVADDAALPEGAVLWTGNVTRQPAFKDKPHRVAPGGLANADIVMQTGLILPCNHAIDDEGIEYICHHAQQFLDA